MKTPEEIVRIGLAALIGRWAWYFIFAYVLLIIAFTLSVWALSLLFGRPL